MNSTKNDTILRACSYFFKIENPEITKYGSGHINSTYLVESEGNRFILQGVNTQVFPNPQNIVNNINIVNDRLRKGPYSLEILEVQPALSGEYIINIEGNYFRVFSFFENTRSYDSSPNENIIYKAGRSFGEFHATLFDLEPSKLEVTLPGFFDFPSRKLAFEDALESADESRSNLAVSEILEIQHGIGVIDSMVEILSFCNKRVIHGDPKLNNILFNQNDDPFGIIDLDTLMAGPLFYDFSDMVRSYSNMAAEDERDLTKVIPSKRYLKALIDGYFPIIASQITEAELQSFLKGFSFITYVQALRFLTDYLNNDIYYQTAYDHQNLDRTKAQLKLYRELEKLRPEIESSIKTYFPK